jgi:hypothetical protein
VNRLAFLASLAGAAALAAGAGAQTPPSNVLVGGALTAADEGYASPHDAFVTVGGDAGAQVPVTATSAIRCGDHLRQVRLDGMAQRDATGAFQVTLPFTADARRLRASVTVIGRTLGDEATGTLTATGSLRLPGSRKAIACTKTTVDWRAHRTGTVPAATGAVPHGALLVGTTTGHDKHSPVSPIVLRTSGDGASLQRIKWRVAIPCDSSDDDDVSWAFHAYKLSAQGKFVADKHAVDPAGDATWDVSVRFGGHVGADGAAGYLRVVEREELHGRTINRCDTGRLHWSAVVTPPPGT